MKSDATNYYSNNIAVRLWCRLQQPAVIDVKLSYDNARVSSWSSTVSMKLDVETSIIKSSVPTIFEDKLAIGSEFLGEYEWGEAKNLTKKVDTVHRVLVQLLRKVRVNLVATQASYDVPFSYTQNDTLINGQNITLNMEDDIYNGVNIYNFKFDQESLQLCECRKMAVSFNVDTAVSGYAKFEVEQAKMENGLVHIRSVYNNKYWVRWSPHHWWIAADLQQWSHDSPPSCPTRPLYMSLASQPSLLLLLVCRSTNPDKSHLDIFPIFDWDSLFILPKYIAFKDDPATDSYLRGKRFQGMNYLTFNGADISSCAVANEVFNTTSARFWSRGCGNWVVAGDCIPNPNDPNTLFFPIKVSNNVVALHNMGNQLFCKRFTGEGIIGGLSAVIPTITPEAKLEVYELVVSKKIENVEFCLSDKRIYDKKVTTIATGIAENRLQQPTMIDVKLSYNDTRVSSWSSTVSMKLDVETSIIKSSVPTIFEDKLAIGSEFSGEYEWGEAKNLTKKVDTVHRVLVQPLRKVRVNLVATQASYDVPFSYTQNDTVINGQNITLNMEDGIYNGVNIYNFKFDQESSQLCQC
ncbi:unnamed protein product [Citrullus colocynthis]|uniref:Agglutinin domain-containing protein n=1 Tax=Citrullus colocynthis TaxID=252529 RepID=A0ABP0Z3D5_9ROSI